MLFWGLGVGLQLFRMEFRFSNQCIKEYNFPDCNETKMNVISILQSIWNSIWNTKYIS